MERRDLNFDGFYLTYYTRLCRILHSRYLDWNLAEDAATEAFMILYRKWDEKQGSGALFAYVALIARRIQSKAYRQRAKQATLSFDEIPGLEAALSTHKDPTSSVVDRLTLQWALDLLPPDKREAWILYELHGLRISEIAHFTGTPAGTVKTRLRSARQALADLLKEHRTGRDS